MVVGVTRYLASVLVLFLLGRAVIAAAPAKNLTDLRRSVFTLHVEQGEDAYSRCTAFAVGNKTFVTASHCVPDASVKIYLLDARGRLWPADVSAFDAALDVATVQSEMAADPLALGDDPFEDDPVLSINGVGGNVLWSLRGRVAGQDRQWIGMQLSGAGPGGSGAPVLCKGEFVCGIVLGAFSTGTLVRMLPISAWRQLLDTKA